jgi:catechol 2,3-dioxygenase-like lactoylglutathione lyase family enzyme
MWLTILLLFLFGHLWYSYMRLLRISAVTLLVNDMNKSCEFYSKIPGFALSYSSKSFTTFTLEENIGKQTHLNLELSIQDNLPDNKPRHFGRIIFHTDDVDALYCYLKNDDFLSKLMIIESKPVNAKWGERYFHIRDPDRYQISFAQPLK